jgi:MarR family transcriptional regulator, organic hydroperoxide resistance regulator
VIGISDELKQRACSGTLPDVTTRTKDKASIAADAWRSIFDFIVGTSGQRNRVLAELGLTPNDSRALGSLDPDAGRTMRSLAQEWKCDASTATWIVDRLEAKGLVERMSHPTDRRVTLVVLTAAGEQTRSEMMTRTYTPPPELLELNVAELVALRDAAASLPGLIAHDSLPAGDVEGHGDH